jgi:hypothetical protein
MKKQFSEDVEARLRARIAARAVCPLCARGRRGHSRPGEPVLERLCARHATEVRIARKVAPLPPPPSAPSDGRLPYHDREVRREVLELLNGIPDHIHGLTH